MTNRVIVERDLLKRSGGRGSHFRRPHVLVQILVGKIGVHSLALVEEEKSMLSIEMSMAENRSVKWKRRLMWPRLHAHCIGNRNSLNLILAYFFFVNTL